MDAYDEMFEAHLRAIDRFGVTGEPLRPRYRCTRSGHTLTPSIPLTGDVVQHVCRACGRSIEQSWRQYKQQGNIRLDVCCPTEEEDTSEEAFLANIRVPYSKPTTKTVPRHPIAVGGRKSDG